MSNSRTIIATGALIAFLAVMAGAFGAHGLKDTLSSNQVDIFQTGVQYQMMHALGLLLIGNIKLQTQEKYLAVAAWLMLTGILLFSGSLYALSLSGIRWLGAITPFGGVCFLLAWLVVCFNFFRQPRG